jgi:hypothetical protein
MHTSIFITLDKALCKINSKEFTQCASTALQLLTKLSLKNNSQTQASQNPSYRESFNGFYLFTESVFVCLYSVSKSILPLFLEAHNWKELVSIDRRDVWKYLTDNKIIKGGLKKGSE